MNPYLQELGCYVGQQCPFDEASLLLERLTGIDLSDKQIERLCHHHGQLLEVELCTDTVSGLDGSILLTRDQPQQPGGWKEIKLARLFKTDHVLAFKERPAIRQTGYVAYLGDHCAFTPRVLVRVGSKRQLIGLGDGARWIWDYFTESYPGAIQILDICHVLEKLGAGRSCSGARPRRVWTGCSKPA